MAQIIKQITVDVAQENLFQPIIAKQKDLNSRFLQVTLVNEKQPIVIAADSTVAINALRDDGQAKAFAGSVQDNGVILVPIAPWMLELDGKVECDISIIDSEERRLTSTSFTINVEPAAYSDVDIEEYEEYNINRTGRRENPITGKVEVYTVAVSGEDKSGTNYDRSSVVAREDGNILLVPIQDLDGTGDPTCQTEVSGINHFIKGRGNKVRIADGQQGGAVVLGDQNIVTTAMSHTVGYENENKGEGAAFVSGNNNKVFGFGAHAEGVANTADGYAAHVEGSENHAKGIYSHAEGAGNTAGNYAHAEGRETIAGNNGHAEGYKSKTTHTDDSGKTIEGAWAHAEGRETTSYGTGSHSEGNGTVASGNDSHAEGYQTVAGGHHSHAEGSKTQANGVSSHSGGSGSIANHENAFTHGYYLETGKDNQFVVGKNNSPNTTDLFQVGNGQSTKGRSNAFRVQENGNAVIAGEVIEQGLPGRTIARYRYSQTEDFMENKIPQTPNEEGVIGEFVVGMEAGYLFICVNTNRWIRIPIGEKNQDWSY